VTHPSQNHLKPWEAKISSPIERARPTSLQKKQPAKETTMARSSARQRQQRATLDALARMSFADGFSPEAARPIQPAYPDYQNRRATEEALAAMAAPTPPTANPITPNIPTVDRQPIAAFHFQHCIWQKV
jgi:hypothetical protein